MEIKINILQANEIVQALNNLSQALGSSVSAPQHQKTVQVPQEQPQQTQQAQQQQPQQTQQAPQSQQQPQTQQQSASVPTSAPQYDMNQLGVAATQLMDAGKQNELLNLLNNQFGVPSLMELPEEQYGAFATELRKLGANI